MEIRTDEPESIFDSIPNSLKWPDYFVFAFSLIGSMGIGVYYGFFDKKNKTNDEYLMAGRSMSLFPVAMSLLCSFVSGVTLLGFPVEAYFYGVNVWMLASHIPLSLAVCYLYLPVYWGLQLTSAYEYLEARFNVTVRRSVSACAVMHLIIFMPLTVWAPALALEQVIGIDKYLSCGIIFVICIVYSSMGGLKAVIWTDTLQAFIMFGALGSIVGIGLSEVGGISKVWKQATEMDRLHLVIWDADPRTRQSVWTHTIGGYFAWLPFVAASQAYIQRYLALPTLSKIEFILNRSIWLNFIGLYFVAQMCSLVGIIMITKYRSCDPVSFKKNMAADQLVPLFVMDVMRDYTGIAGLFISGVVCGSLSSISSALNAVPSLVVTDFVNPLRPGLSDHQLKNISKIISVVSGIISFGITFIMGSVGNILPFASLLHGTFLGPIIGVFTLGMLFPWSNALGSVLGIVPSLVITLFLGVGAIVEKDSIPNQRLPLNQDGCYVSNISMVSTASIVPTVSSNFDEGRGIPTDWKNQEYSGLINFLGTSHAWYPGITVVTTVFFGLLFSFIINYFHKPKLVKSKYLTPIMLKFWKKILGEKKLTDWIEYS